MASGNSAKEVLTQHHRAPCGGSDKIVTSFDLPPPPPPIRQSVNLHDQFREEKEIFQTALEGNELKKFYPPKWKRF